MKRERQLKKMRSYRFSDETMEMVEACVNMYYDLKLPGRANITRMFEEGIMVLKAKLDSEYNRMANEMKVQGDNDA